MTKYLSRDQILGYNDLETKEVEVPEWGGTIRVRSLTGKEWAGVEDSLRSKNGTPASHAGFREWLVAMAAVDEKGEQLFSLEDVELLGKKNWTALERVSVVVVDISGATPDKVGELVGKSGTTPAKGSSTG